MEREALQKSWRWEMGKQRGTGLGAKGSSGDFWSILLWPLTFGEKVWGAALWHNACNASIKYELQFKSWLLLPTSSLLLCLGKQQKVCSSWPLPFRWESWVELQETTASLSLWICKCVCMCVFAHVCSFSLELPFKNKVSLSLPFLRTILEMSPW